MNQTLEASSYPFSSPYDIFQHLSTPADICKNQTLIEECDTMTIGNYIIHSPELLPCCLMALILGLTFAHKLLQIKSKNSLFHAITFAMIGVMMTSAGMADCILPDLFPKNIMIHYYYAIIDVGLTSSIGFAFLINGLLDAGILSEKSPLTWTIFGSGVTGIFLGWAYTFTTGSQVGILVLYMGIVGIGCGAWTFIELKLVFEQKDWKSFRYLILAGLHGGLGFYSILSVRMRVWLCENVNCHFATDFIWFLVTDTAMYFIYKYYKSRAKFGGKSNGLIRDERYSVSWL